MMRKTLLTAGLLCAFISADLNAQIRIRNLPVCPSVVSGDMIPSAAVSGATCKYTVGQLLTGYVPVTRTITCTAPLLCAGGSSHDLASDFTISLSGGGSGEVNTASNVGASGVGTYDSKSGVDLRFRKINGASSKLTATLNSQQIDLDVPDAGTSQKGAVQLAGVDGTDTTAGKAVQASDARLAAATTSNRGTVLLATPSSDVTVGHVVQASDTRLSDARTPTSHVHNASDVNAGTLAAARLPTATTSVQGAAILATPSSDVTAGHVVQANDTRLLDSRAPSGAAGGDLGGTYPNPTISARTVPQGGTGVATLAVHGVVLGNGASAINVTGAGIAGSVLTSNGPSADPTFQPVSSSTLIARTTTESRNTSTISADGTLVVSVTSGNSYRIIAQLIVAADTSGGFQFIFAGTAALDIETMECSANGYTLDTFTGAEDPTYTFPMSMAGADTYLVRCAGFLHVTSAGNYSLQWAQGVASGTTSINPGSWILIQK